jgi:hypothetical protein
MASSEPVVVDGVIVGAVFVVVTWTLQSPGPTSLRLFIAIVVTASYGGINTILPLDATGSLFTEPVYVA